jgi:uncharacterized cupredoxin-like copper-binding protein
MSRTCLALVAALCFGIACGGATAGSVEATLTDFDIVLTSDQLSAGGVRFQISNEGAAPHELIIVQTNRSPDALPTTPQGRADLEAKGLGVVGAARGIEPGASSTLEVDLKAGSYAAICNIGGHYQQGMFTGLTVTE